MLGLVGGVTIGRVLVLIQAGSLRSPAQRFPPGCAGFAALARTQPSRRVNRFQSVECRGCRHACNIRADPSGAYWRNIKRKEWGTLYRVALRRIACSN